MKKNNFCRFWGVLTLSFVFIVGAAQTTTERPSSNKPVGSFTVIGDNSNSSGTSVKYKKDELYVQKDDVYYKPTDHGFEKTIQERQKARKKKDEDNK